MTLEEEIIAIKDGKHYVREALKNAEQFLSDAKVLMESGSYAHAAALAVLGIEECVKAKIASKHLSWDGSFEVDVKTYREEIKNHFSKLSLAAKDHAITALARHLMPEGFCSLQELYQRLKQTIEKEDNFLRDLEIESTLYACLTILKEKWLYVDVRDGEVTTPLIWSKEDAEKVLSMAEKRVGAYKTDIMRDLGEI
ncbi:MAG: AbiV family abortive infection protein [archaeon]|nr:AbiV family abortive infection protein [archaeon]MCP8314724.1 AbiV family abortive infection protein [archaeon]